MLALLMAIATLLVPYERIERGSRSLRRCAIDVATTDIYASGGEWSESEINGDKAIVRVRASQGVIDNLTKSWEPVGDPGAIWTPTRRSPKNNKGDIEWVDRGHTCKPLAALAKEVLDDQKLGERLALIDALTAHADRKGYHKLTGLPWDEAAAILVECAKRGYGLDRISTGTFPTTSVLDNFTRADSTDLGTNWTVLGSGPAMRIVSNTAQCLASDDNGQEYWNATTFGPDSEAYLTVNGTEVQWKAWSAWLRITTPGGSYDGYMIEAYRNEGATDTFAAYRWDNASATQLGANMSQEFGSGDGVGAEMISSTLTAYYRTGGVWSSKGTRTDSTYSTAGNVAIGLVDRSSDAYIDDFGGGTVVTASGSNVPRPSTIPSALLCM